MAIDFKKLSEESERRKNLSPEDLKKEEDKKQKEFNLSLEVDKACKTKFVLRGTLPRKGEVGERFDLNGDKTLSFRMSYSKDFKKSEDPKVSSVTVYARGGSDFYDSLFKDPVLKTMFDRERSSDIGVQVCGYFVPFKDHSGKTNFSFTGTDLQFLTEYQMREDFKKPLIQDRPFDYSYTKKGSDFVFDLTDPDMVFCRKEAVILAQAIKNHESRAILLFPQLEGAGEKYEEFFKEKGIKTSSFYINELPEIEGGRVFNALLKDKASFVKPNNFYKQPNVLFEEFCEKRLSQPVLKKALAQSSLEKTHER